MNRGPIARMRLGLRCEALVLLGGVWVLMGLGVERGASHPPDGLLFTYIPHRVRAVLWIATGLAAVVSAIRSSRTDWALAGLMVMPLFRLVSYLYAWALWEHPGPDHGEYPDGWYQAGYYLVMVGFVFFVAHIPPAIMRSWHSPDRERECDKVRERQP